MTELEVKPEHAADPDTRRVGILVGVVGVLLSVATIASHRAHTNAVIHKTEANDQWSYYQAKKIRQSSVEAALAVLDALAPDPQKAAAAVRELQLARDHYGRDAAAIEKAAEARESEARLEERRALSFDIGEGLLELGLVLCSLYFLARKRFFPALGIVASGAGTLLAAWGWLLR